MAATAYVRRGTKAIPSALTPTQRRGGVLKGYADMQHKTRNDGRGRVGYEETGGMRVAILRHARATETTTSAVASSQRRGGVMI